MKPNKNIENIIEKVNNTMKIENMPLTEEDKKSIRNILSGKTTVEEELKKD